MNDALRQALRSVVVITVTPFDDSGTLDEKTYAALVDRVVDAGVVVVTPNGNTSEFYSLSRAELYRSVEITVEAAGGRATVMPGVGFDVASAVELARQAERAGAGAVMVHQPVHPYISAQGWVDYHRAVADAVPELGVVCYVRSPLVTPDALAQLAEHCPNFVGVKYAVADPLLLATAVAAVGPDRLAWVCGLAETWAPFFWTAGAHGFTSGLATIAPDLSLNLLHQLRAGAVDSAMALWHKLKPLEDARARHGSANNVSVVKEALAQLGLCRREVRPPISVLSQQERAEVAAILAAWGLG